MHVPVGRGIRGRHYSSACPRKLPTDQYASSIDSTTLERARLMQETHIDEAFKQQSKSRAILLSLLVVAVGIAVVLGIVLTKDGEKSGKESTSPIQSETETPVAETETPSSEPVHNSNEEFWETGIVEILGEALPADIDLGYTAPAFKAQPNNSAETITIDPADGTVRLIGFFALTQKEVEDLQSF